MVALFYPLSSTTVQQYYSLQKIIIGCQSSDLMARVALVMYQGKLYN